MQSELQGAYALVLMTADRVVGVRDPHGIRPLALGERDGIFMLASESCAIDATGGQFLRDVQPGEIISLTAAGVTSRLPDAHPADTPACLNMSTLPARTAFWTGRMSLLRALPLAASWHLSSPVRQTWSLVHLIQDWPPR
jgi:asparagine synthetase B (glutamine-hydrolysing)